MISVLFHLRAAYPFDMHIKSGVLYITKGGIFAHALLTNY